MRHGWGSSSDDCDWIPTALHCFLYLLGAVFAVVFAIAVFGILLLVTARAHGPADWIQRGQYKNAAGELCCGERDCAELADGDVQVTPQGYLIKSIGETVPFHEATPSPDGIYWRCYWGGKRKCFFFAPGSA